MKRLYFSPYATFIKVHFEWKAVVQKVLNTLFRFTPFIMILLKSRIAFRNVLDCY